MEDQTQTWTDKIAVAMLFVEKEIQISELFNYLHSNIKLKYMEKDNLERYQEYSQSWQYVMQLYDLLETDYLGKLKKRNEEIYKQVVDIKNRWDDPSKESKYEELQVMVKAIHKLMSYTGFLDIVRKNMYGPRGMKGAYDQYSMKDGTGETKQENT